MSVGNNVHDEEGMTMTLYGWILGSLGFMTLQSVLGLATLEIHCDPEQQAARMPSPPCPHAPNTRNKKIPETPTQLYI